MASIVVWNNRPFVGGITGYYEGAIDQSANITIPQGSSGFVLDFSFVGDYVYSLEIDLDGVSVLSKTYLPNSTGDSLTTPLVVSPGSHVLRCMMATRGPTKPNENLSMSITYSGPQIGGSGLVAGLLFSAAAAISVALVIKRKK